MGPDSDGDSIPDKYDKCPNSPKGAVVDYCDEYRFGCADGEVAKAPSCAPSSFPSQQPSNYPTRTPSVYPTFSISSTSIPSHLPTTSCGNGIIEPSLVEECDDGIFNGEDWISYCTVACTFIPNPPGCCSSGN